MHNVFVFARQLRDKRDELGLMVRLVRVRVEFTSIKGKKSVHLRRDPLDGSCGSRGDPLFVRTLHRDRPDD